MRSAQQMFDNLVAALEFIMKARAKAAKSEPRMRSAQQMFDNLVQIMRPLVEAIESAPPTTANNYGEYISALTRAADTLAEVLHDKPRNEIYIVLSAAMFRAGANPQGLRAALRILGAAPPPTGSQTNAH